MRKIFIALCTMVSVITGNAQNTPIGENIELAGENPEELKVIYVNKDVSTHFIAMEDIKYVDISVNDIVGDIPTGNSLRIKVSIRPRACFSPSYNKVKSQTKHVWLLTLL